MKKIFLLLSLFALLNTTTFASVEELNNFFKNTSKNEELSKSKKDDNYLMYQHLFIHDINYEYKSKFENKLSDFDNTKVDNNIYFLLETYYNLKELNPTELEYKNDIEKINNIKSKLFPDKDFLTVEDNLLLVLFFQAKDDRFLNAFIKTNVDIQNLILVYLNSYIWRHNWINWDLHYFENNEQLNKKVVEELEKNRLIFIPLNWKEFDESMQDYDFGVIHWIKSKQTYYWFLEILNKDIWNKEVSKNIYNYINNFPWNIEKLPVWQKAFISFYKTNKNNLKSQLLNEKYIKNICEKLEINKCNIINLIKNIKSNELLLSEKYSVKDNLDKKIEYSKYYDYDKELFKSKDDLYNNSDEEHIFLDKLYYIYSKWDKFEDRDLFNEVVSILKTYHFIQYQLFNIPEIFSNYEIWDKYISENLNLNYWLDFKYR